MADIRIKDLATTATTTASDDFMAVDGAINGTRKLSAAAPAFLTSVTTPSLTAPASTDLTLAGGSSGASLVLGQGATGAAAIAATSGGLRGLLIGSTSSSANFPLRLLLDADAAVTNDFTNTNVGASAIMRLSLVSSSGTSSWSAYSAAHSVFPGSTLLTAPGAGGLVLLATNATGPIDFYTNSSQAARLTAARNLLIGTTSETGLTGAGGLKINSSTAGASNAGALVVAGGISAGNTGAASYFGGAVTSVGAITLDATQSLNRALIIGLLAQSGGNLPYVSIKPVSTFSDFALNIENTNSTSGQGLGLRIVAGSTASDIPLYVRDRTNATTLFSVGGTGAATFAGAVTIGGNVGFYNASPVAKPTGVAVTAAAIHAALVTLNLIAA